MTRLNKEQKEQVEAAILEVSAKYFLRDGYDDVSVKTIAEEVGIAEGTVFNYFPSKAHLFLEVIARNQNAGRNEEFLEIDFSAGVSEIITMYLEKNVRMILKLPKRLICEVFNASTSIAKKKPGLFKKLAEIDYKFIESLTELLDDLIERNLLKECDTITAAESVYSFFMFDLISYAYEEEKTKEILYESIHKKVNFLVKGYLKS